LKKFFTIFFILCILCSSSLAKEITLTYDGASHIYTGPSITLKLNGNTFAPDEKLMPPVIIDNRTLVPAREVFEAIGGSVTWNQEDRTILVEIENNKILLTLDKAVAIVNDKSVDLDVPAKLINSKTMVPVRFISENCGLSVEWDDATKTVSVSKAAIINNIKDVTAEVINGITSIKIKTDAPIIKYNIFNLTEPNRIIIDLFDSKFDFNYETILLENNNIQNIRFGVQENNVNRIVIDVTELK
jgi:N-acetylmuramoyl-L-alanine amidase